MIPEAFVFRTVCACICLSPYTKILLTQYKPLVRILPSSHLWCSWPLWWSG